MSDDDPRSQDNLFTAARRVLQCIRIDDAHGGLMSLHTIKASERLARHLEIEERKIKQMLAERAAEMKPDGDSVVVGEKPVQAQVEILRHSLVSPKPNTSNREIVQRRFGSRFGKPCANPNMLECASWECQVADKCRLLADDK